MKLDTAIQQEEKSFKSRYKSQRPTHSHSPDSHKNAKLKAIVCIRKGPDAGLQTHVVPVLLASVFHLLY